MKKFALIGLVLSLVAGCTTTVAPNPAILRVGVDPDSPPLIFKQGGQYSGVEADFARELGEELDRKVVFVEVPWEDLIERLEENKIDIIMSGMTVTPAREYRVNFTKPYMVSGLTALFRRSDYASGGLIPSVVRHQQGKIGVIENTTGEFYASGSFKRAKVITYSRQKSAVEALKDGKVDMLIHDAPRIWWIESREEADLVAFRELLNNEPLAWGVSKNNRVLLGQVNQLLERWREDGSGAAILRNWFPNKAAR